MFLMLTVLLISSIFYLCINSRALYPRGGQCCMYVHNKPALSVKCCVLADKPAFEVTPAYISTQAIV